MNRYTKLYRILCDHLFIKALVKGVVAATEHLDVLRGLGCSSVVDIGANRGQFALVSRRSFRGARIHSMEPLDEPAETFSAVFSADSNTHLYRCAIGPESTQSTMHVSNQDDSSSLLPISSLQNLLFPGTAEKEVRTVQVLPLDAILGAKEIQKPALLKVDVQGYEKEALEGCKSLLPSFSYVYVECSFVELYAGQSLAHEVISFLNGFDFLLSGIYNLHYDKNGLAIQGDFLFKNRNIPA